MTGNSILARPSEAGSGGLQPFFAASGIAVLGASADVSRTGGRTLAVLSMTGYAGAIHPVNPGQSSINGLACHADIAAVPDPVDLAIVCLAAHRVPDAIRSCARRGIRAVVVFADGFADPALGADLRAALAEARALCGLRMIGPNTVGVRCVNDRVYATFATDVGTGGLPGSIATIGQSGGLTVYFGSAYLERRGIGSKYIIDTGAEFDIDAADALDYVALDPEVSCAALILEGCRDGARLLRAVDHMRERGKQVVLWKIGRSRAGLEQVASHTGALAGEARVFESALRAHGAIVVGDEVELVDCVTIAAARRVPTGRRLGLVTPSGGYAIATLDAAERFDMEVPQPAEPPNAAQREAMGDVALHNPLDYSASIASGPVAERAALEWMAAQPNLDAILLWQAYANLNPARRDKLRATLTGLAAQSDRPIFGCGMTTPAFEQELRRLGVLWFEEPTRLVRALSLVAPPSGGAVSLPGAAIAADPGSLVSGGAARSILAAIPHLPQVETIELRSQDEIAEHAARPETKWFLKLESDAVPHKTEFGLVQGPLDSSEIERAYAGLASKQAAIPGSRIVLQPAEAGVELAFGMRRDPVFGPTVMVAIGGIFLEVFEDAAFAVAPIDAGGAERLILGLKGAKLLLGARGKPLADIEAAAAALAGLSRFAVANAGAFREIDINPVIVRPRGKGVVAVDALLVRNCGG